MTDFICAIGLLLIFEGLPYFLSPRGMKGIVSKIPEQPDSTLRTIGVFAILAGLALVYLGRH